MFKQCIHQLFEAQVARTPQAVAVECGQKQLTYQELNIKANQLAHYLQKLGVGSEVLVGICLDRSLEMIVALLGILKAGGAYVPLDPAYPAERLEFMLQDAQISILVTQQKWSSLISDYSDQVICLDNHQDEIANESDWNLFNTVKPNNLAYVIYTSGSTGKPKGVMIEHQSLVNFTQMAIAQYKISASDAYGGQSERILQFTSMSFDVSAEEIYPCLSCGATLVLRREEMIGSVASFVQKSQDWQITVWDLPTAYWHLIVNELVTGQIKLPESLRLVIIGGERALPEQVRMWLKFVGNFPELINSYGPTEITIAATTCTLSNLSYTQLEGTEIPIGKPMGDNIQVYVLDRNLHTVPTGTIGEIYIGGAGLARGYLNRPELTAEKFIKNPFDNSKLYKTGDLGRYLPDGNLEFKGRIDDQVKINGFRIELGEIESVLNQHSHVSQSVVIVREDTPGNKYLAGYIVPYQKTEINCTNLQSFLKKKLPSYMVPTVFVALDALPLNPNGKIDRQALPAPKLHETFVAPRNDQEEAIAKIWRQVFGLEQIGVDDNFFQLGGHSLIATQILSRIRDVFQVELSFGQLLNNPTINDLVKIIVQQQLKHSSPLAKIQPISREGYLPVSFAQERVYFIEQLAPSMSAYQFQESLRFKGYLNISILEQSLSEILRRHEIFRTTFPVVEGKLVQVIHSPQPVKLQVIDLQSLPKSEQEAEVQRLTDEAIQKPFDISQLPLIRWTLLKLSDQEYVLVHVEHHMVHDGWSFNLFLRELLTLYQAFSEGKLYTSGSTGKPKGVLIEHHSLVNFTQMAIAQYKLTECDTYDGQSDRILQFASISFDAAAEEIYPCLSSGGTLVLRNEEMLQSVSAFVQQSKDWELTVWDLPTAYWHLLVSELASENLSLPDSLRLVIIGGERVLPEKVAMWHQLVGNYPQLVNSYGPTETTVVATLSELSENALNRQDVTIGKPISNVQVYVLDKYLQPVPIGVPGELHIGGAGVARGYLNRPELTLEKFIPNPLEETGGRRQEAGGQGGQSSSSSSSLLTQHSARAKRPANSIQHGLNAPLPLTALLTQHSQERLYKTGDLARYLPDGNIEYLGRIDNQVKIRGFRIELGEIETVLNQHSQVAQAVVIACEDIPGNKRLVAYVVGNQGQVQIDEIRQFLKQKLPLYMVPSAFVPLEKLPITRNGKLDYRALPAPEISDRNLDLGVDQVLSASAMFGSVKEWKSEQSKRGNRSHLLAVSGLIHSGKLEIDFAYSDKVHKRDTIERLAFKYMEALRKLIAHCQLKESQGYTPSDFSAARVNQNQLDKFIAKINKSKTK